MSAPHIAAELDDAGGGLGEVVDNDAIEIGELYEKARISIVESVRYQIECGQRLVEKKASMAHGEWLPWLQSNAGVLGFETDRTAQMLMKVAKANTKPASDFDHAQAVQISRQTWGHDKNIALKWTGDPEWFTPAKYIEAAREHLGGEPEHYPINQGFDEAVWHEGNPPWWGFNRNVKRTDNAGYTDMGGLVWSPAPENFPYDTGGIMRGKKGEEPEMVAPFSMELYNTMDTDVADDVIDFIDRQAKSAKPFFVYYAGKGNHFWGAHPDFMNQPAGTNNSAQMAEHDHNVGRLLDSLNELGIAENTLVVWMSDNGPMYAMHPHGGYSLLRGEKSDNWEGGVRVPGLVWWPGTIDKGQEPIDIVQVTDMFTTAASIAGVKSDIPSDRVTDGVDQSALLLLGEGKSRRDYIFHYDKGKLEAVRKDQLKFFTKPEKPHHNCYNLYHDPGERYPDLARYCLWAAPGFGKLIQDHMAMIKKFPHRIQTSHQLEFDVPFDPEK